MTLLDHMELFTNSKGSQDTHNDMRHARLDKGQEDLLVPST